MEKAFTFIWSRLKLTVVTLVLLLSTGVAYAQTTYDWTGATSSAWEVNTNWKVGSSTATTAPSLSTDIIRIGTVVTTLTNQPTINSSVSCASITFGALANGIILTVNSGVILTVSNINANHSSTGNSGTSYVTQMVGGGVINATTIQVGDNQQPASGLSGIVYTQLSSQLTLNITGNLILNSVGNNGGGVNWCEFDLDAGTTSLDGQIITQNVNTYSGTQSALTVAIRGKFSADNTTTASTLILNNNNAIQLPIADGQVVDFTNNGTGSCTIIYNSNSGSQFVYTGLTDRIGKGNNVYENLTLQGASTKVTGGNYSASPNNKGIDVGVNLVTQDGPVDMVTNNSNFNIGGSWTNSATVTQGSGTIWIGGNLTNNNPGVLNLGTGALNITGNYSNSATFTAGTGMVTFNGGSAETLTDNGNGTQFNNVTFNNGGTKTMSSGNFSVSSTGILTMGSNTQLGAGGYLTLNSDANSSATVAALPKGSSITGNVNVQRFIQGSSTSLTKRGYRLISSAVYTGNAAGSNVFDLNYLLNSVLVTGLNGTANGFSINGPTNNASLYLFREDLSPPPANGVQFRTQYNWKGIAKINNTNAYDIGTQKRKTTINAADTTTTIPVGNGVLFFFRGNATINNGTTSGTKVTSPYNYPEDVTTTQVGALNTGTVNVKLWFANAANGLGNNFSYTVANVNNGTSSLRGGFNFVGNPYAATINWEKFNRNSTASKSSIYGGGSLPSTIWVFNEANNQFDSYKLKTGTADTTSINPGTVTGSASNMIASGQGFFIAASATGQTLSFRETAKTSTQPPAAALHDLMGIPEVFASTPEPLLRLKLIRDSINTDEIVIRLANNASTKFVFDEDAEDMGGNGALESLSAFSSDSTALAIDFTPFPGKQQQVIHLFADAVYSGTYKLASTQLYNLPPLYSMWLKDAFTNDSLQLKSGAVYSFQIDKGNPATFGSGRFSVVIGQNPAYAYQLLDFTATKVPSVRRVQLVWKTANEENYTNFTVERSTDGGKSFNVIGGLKGTGAGTYSLLDKNPITGQNLYRLKQEDINNTITYSKVITVQYTDQDNQVIVNKISIYPNPTSNIINLEMNTGLQVSAYHVRIVNSLGTVVKESVFQQNNWNTNISNLKPGTYLVQVINNNDNSLVGIVNFVKN